jgi:hypothetical protein
MIELFRSTEGKFFSACKGGNLSVIRILLSKYPHINKVRDKDNRSGLSHAVENGSYSVVEKLIPYYDEDTINTYDKLGATPLAYAISKGNCSIIKLLIQNGADASRIDHINRTHYSDSTHRGSMAISPVEDIRKLAFEIFVIGHNPISDFLNIAPIPLVDTYNPDPENEAKFGVELGHYCFKICTRFSIVKSLFPNPTPSSLLSFLILVMTVSEHCVRWVLKISEERRKTIFFASNDCILECLQSIYPETKLRNSSLPDYWISILVDFEGANPENDFMSDWFLKLYELRGEVYEQIIERIRQKGGSLSTKEPDEFKELAIAFVEHLHGKENQDNSQLVSQVQEIAPRLFGELSCKCRVHLKLY